MLRANTADFDLVEACLEAPDRAYSRATLLELVGTAFDPIVINLEHLD